MKLSKKFVASVALFASILGLAACGKKESATKAEKPKDAPDTWIADTTVTGLVFQSDIDSKIPDRILKELKKKTGVTLKLQSGTGNSSLEALIAGLAAGDLPDFVCYYLNNSGRPEMPVILKAAKEGQFMDLTKYLKEGKVYSKYFDKGYLPQDTEKNIMFRKDLDGTFFVHMSIPREPGKVEKKYVGGPYIQKDIIDKLGIDPLKIDTSEKVEKLLEDIQKLNLKDKNGKPITPLGPTVWGGADRRYIYEDQVWTGSGDELFQIDDQGNVKHESETDWPEKRIKYVRELLAKNLMHQEFYTMEENRAVEGVINKSFGIVADIHNYMPQNSDLKYLPLGPLNTVKGPNKMVINYKTGYNGWSIPTTTKDPEVVAKLADFLASKEGKLLWMYGIEGEDYDLVDGKPVVKKEILELKEKEPDKAKELGFAGVGNYWGEALGSTDMDNVADFGEAEWGMNEQKDGAAQKILDFYHYDDRLKNAEIVDGLTPLTFLDSFDKDGKLKIALDTYKDNLLRCFYAKSDDEAAKILKESRDLLNKSGLQEFDKYVVEQSKKEGVDLKF